MNIKHILTLDIDDVNRMNRKELVKIVNSLSSASNKRLRRLEQAGLTDAFAYQSNRGEFSTKGKNVNELRQEFARNRDFLQSKTSSVSGYRKFLRETGKRIGGEAGIDFLSQENNRRKFWSTYNKMKELYPDITSRKGGSRRLQELVLQAVKSNPSSSDDDIIDILRKQLDIDYERVEYEYSKRESEIEDDDFFDVWGDRDESDNLEY